MFSEVVVSYGLFLTAERETNKKTTKSRCQINSNNSFRMKRISSYLLNSLSRDKVSVERTEQKSKSMYQCINMLAPVYLCNTFTPRTLSFDLRDARGKSYLPKPRTAYPKSSFSYSRASLCNDLPEELLTVKFQ